MYLTGEACHLYLMRRARAARIRTDLDTAQANYYQALDAHMHPMTLCALYDICTDLQLELNDTLHLLNEVTP